MFNKRLPAKHIICLTLVYIEQTLVHSYWVVFERRFMVWREIMKYKIVLLFSILFISGCSTMTPPRYSVNADNNATLREIEITSIAVVDYSDASEFAANCRLMGPIEASDQRGIAQFIADSFNDEFKFAEKYGGATAQTKLHLTLTDAEFSSVAGLTNGYWNLGITIENVANGASINASTHYSFRSGFDAITACNQTAQALTPAVQDLIGRTLNQTDFNRLIKG